MLGAQEQAFTPENFGHPAYVSHISILGNSVESTAPIRRASHANPYAFLFTDIVLTVVPMPSQRCKSPAAMSVKDAKILAQALNPCRLASLLNRLNDRKVGVHYEDCVS
jgi:hypothetical protein